MIGVVGVLVVVVVVVVDVVRGGRVKGFSGVGYSYPFFSVVVGYVLGCRNLAEPLEILPLVLTIATRSQPESGTSKMIKIETSKHTV